MRRWAAGSVVVAATVLALAVAAPSSQRLADDGACHETAATAHWTEVLYRRADEPAFRYLDHLRNRLCAMIDEGAIGLDDAGVLFERERLRLYRALREREFGNRSSGAGALG